MAQQPQIIKATSVNMDVSEKYLKDSEAAYLLNYNILNPDSLGKAVPFNANIQFCEMDMAQGVNFNGGRYYSPITKEMYYWTYNSNGINFISRTDKNGICEVVYTNDGINNCLSVNPNPQNEITKWRAYLYVEKSDCANRHGKYLVWTDGDSFIGWIDVEASIATNSFTTPFFENCVSGCENIMLCAPKLCECLSAEFVPLEDADKSLTNNILDKGFKFIYRGLYYDNLRATEWSDPSTLYYEDITSCFYNSKGFSRCLKLHIPIGNPLWDKIEIGFSKGDIDSNGEGIWYLADTIDLYEKYNSSQQYWYERSISNSLMNYADCSFDYLFCNNKQCQVISTAEVSRVYNPIPLKAQGILNINGAFGFYNYEQGNCPIDKSEINKFQITPVYDEGTGCVPEMVSLTVRAIIHSLTTSVNQFVWRGGGVFGDEDDLTDTAYFGGLQDISSGPTVTAINSGHNQQFNGTIRDFIVYVEGTEFFGVMQQCVSSGDFTTPNIVGVLAGAKTGADFISGVSNVRGDGDFYYQQATLLLPKGMKGILRICSNNATGLEPDTSTKVAGTIDDINGYAPDTVLANFNHYEFEIPFDCSQSEILKTFIIDDATLASTSGHHSSVETVGYIKDNIGTPLEGLEIWAAKESPTSATSMLAKTDYNGFYYLYNYTGKIVNSTAQIRGEIDCDTWGFLQAIGLNRTNYGGTNTSNATIGSQTYLNNKFTIIQANVKDCNNTPVQGVKVAFSGSKSQITLSDGTAIIKARNYSTRDRVIDAIVMANYGCFNLDCNQICNPCSPDESTSTPACYNKDTIPLSPMVINLSTAITHSKGLKSGGEYPFGFVVEGGCGKISAVNELPNIVIEKTQLKDKFDFPSFTYDATGMILPDWANCLKIVRGVNLNDYALQWLVDKVEKTADRKLKITIQSLNDYNAKFFHKTNTTYQYQDGDRVEFIRNGDGKIFDTDTNGLLNYQILSPFLDQLATGQTTSAANYFNQILIDDDGKLDSLVAGAMIELQHAKTCVTEPVYFSICASIPTYVDANGITRLVAETGSFRTFDTYFVQRQVGSFSIQTFESKTPSDFWGGTGIDDTGLAYFVNKYENEKRYGRNISIGSPTQLNYFGDSVKTFDAPEQGDITAMNIEGGAIIIAIGENDWFLAEVSNDLVKVGADGVIRAASPDQVISDPQTKVRGKYGCGYDDIGSVFFGDGFVTWVDGARNAYVLNNYREATDMSLGKMQSYFRNKIQYKNQVNANETDFLNHIRWVTGQNKVSKSLILTIKSWNQGSFNNDYAPYTNPNSTISFDIDSQSCLTFNSFTPEGFETFDLNDSIGSAFICFYQGVPYLHPIKATVFNNFFGQSVDMVAAISANKYPEKLKNFIACEVQSDKMWFIKDVKTNDPNFDSEVPPIRFKQVGDKWSAGLLGNKNSFEGIFSNKMPSGYYCLITFVRDNTVNLVYNSISDVSREQYSELDMITCKFNLLEQSGFTENL